LALEFHYSPNWSVSRDDIPQKIKQHIAAKMFMLTIIWGIDGFHLADLATE
jgi:hypothetical protein